MGTKLKEQAIPGSTGANRPDLSIISPDESSIMLVEVSCPFEGSPTALEDAARSKIEKYEPLRQALLQRYASVEILPFIVGSLGSWYPPNDRVLTRLHIGWKYASLMRRLCVVSAIAGSQAIWYKKMCTQRRVPGNEEHPAVASVGLMTADNGSADNQPIAAEPGTVTVNGSAEGGSATVDNTLTEVVVGPTLSSND